MGHEISVIIPTYNSAAYLPEAIESALNQTVAPLEVIVVDDGSTDQTAQILEHYSGRIVLIAQENRGLSAARNRGMEEARGDLIAFLDADDVWLSGKLEKQLSCLEDHPRAGLVHSAVIFWEARTGRKYWWDDGKLATGSCYEVFFRRNVVVVSSVIVRKECLDRIGNFDEELRRRTCEDYDLWFRIARHYELAYVEEPLTLYRLHDANASRRTLAMAEDSLYVVRKALRADPELGRSLGRGVVDRRLFELHFNVGYHHHDAGRTAEARSAFLQALQHRPFSTRAWSLYLLNFLHPEWVGGLRKWKSSLSSLGRRKPGPTKAEKWIEQHRWLPERPQERGAAPPDIE
jgi:glycosyltransferase involved in cell wall biosynthesis